MTENASDKEFRMTETAAHGPEESPPSQGGGYLGSVRFFKHLILTALALAILIPTTLSIILGLSLGRMRAELAELRGGAGRVRISALAAEFPSDSNVHNTPAEDLTQVPKEDEGLKPELPAYQSLYPDLYARPAERNSVDLEKVVYLSFDDGPSKRTPELLEILERYGAKATFFVTGNDSEEGRQWMRDIVAAGHTLGIHSYSHDYETIYRSVEAFLDDFALEYALIQDATGISPQIFRFPGGSVNVYNGHIYQEIVSEMTRRGFVYFDWNRQTGEAVLLNASAQTLTKNALEQASSMRRIFLLSHDSTCHTNVVKALPCIIEGYREAGFTFDALTAEVKPVIYGYPG